MADALITLAATSAMFVVAVWVARRDRQRRRNARVDAAIRARYQRRL